MSGFSSFVDQASPVLPRVTLSSGHAACPPPSLPAVATKLPVPSLWDERVSQSWRTVTLIFVYSALLGLGAFAFNGRYTLNLADEGFLRYGVHAIMTTGQVPMRDFQAYDPGRYYWIAGWSLLLGDGIVSTRLACALFQVLAVGIALLALRRAGARWWLLGTAGLLVTFWMLERFKLFEQCVALMALYPAIRLIRRPDRAGALLAGRFVGWAAFMGRNHGFYNASAFGALLLLLVWKHRRRDLFGLVFPWWGGIALGYSPMLLMMGFVPGFFSEFVESLQVLARAKATNFVLPVPWPWTIDTNRDLSAFEIHCELAFAWCFVLLIIGFATSAVAIARLPGSLWREKAGLVAACVVGIPYAHFAFSRADAPHLAHSMPLLLIALLGLPTLLVGSSDRAKAFGGLGVALMVLTYLATFNYNPVAVRLGRGDLHHVVKIGGQTLCLNPGMTEFVENLQQFSRRSMAPDENILIAPFSPMLYEVVGRASPLHEIYFLWPQSAESAHGMMLDLERKNVNWVLLEDKVLDDIPERSLASSHPLLMQYLRNHFEQVTDAPIPSTYLLLRRTSSMSTVRP